MVNFLRTILGIAAGILLAAGLVIAVELWSNVVHPLPPGVEHTPEVICAHVERYPPWILAVAAVAWGATTYASTWVASRIGNWISGALVGLLLLAMVLFNMSMLPYPLWFEAANVVIFPLAILLGLRGTRRRHAEPNRP